MIPKNPFLKPSPLDQRSLYPYKGYIRFVGGFWHNRIEFVHEWQEYHRVVCYEPELVLFDLYCDKMYGRAIQIQTYKLMEFITEFGTLCYEYILAEFEDYYTRQFALTRDWECPINRRGIK